MTAIEVAKAFVDKINAYELFNYTLITYREINYLTPFSYMPGEVKEWR